MLSVQEELLLRLRLSLLQGINAFNVMSENYKYIWTKTCLKKKIKAAPVHMNMMLS